MKSLNTFLWMPFIGLGFNPYLEKANSKFWISPLIFHNPRPPKAMGFTPKKSSNSSYPIYKE